MFAKIINDSIAYLCNVQIEDGLIEFEDCEYPVFHKGKIINAEDEDHMEFLTGSISSDELKQRKLDKLRLEYIEKWEKNDREVLMYLKRGELGILDSDDETKYKNALNEYKKSVTEYRKLKHEIKAGKNWK